MCDPSMVRCPTLCAAIPQWSADLHCVPPYTAFHQAGGNKETDAENKYLREETAETLLVGKIGINCYNQIKS